MTQFSNSVIVITGASSGIGRALAIELAPQSPKLVLAARNRTRLDEVSAACQQLGAETLVVPTDVTVEAQCRELVERAAAHFGGVNVLVSNAGRAMWTRFDTLTDLSIMEDVMRLNYLGSVYCTFHALPHLKQSRGLIVGVASISGLIGAPLLSTSGGVAGK